MGTDRCRCAATSAATSPHSPPPPNQPDGRPPRADRRAHRAVRVPAGLGATGAMLAGAASCAAGAPPGVLALGGLGGLLLLLRGLAGHGVKARGRNGEQRAQEQPEVGVRGRAGSTRRLPSRGLTVDAPPTLPTLPPQLPPPALAEPQGPPPALLAEVEVGVEVDELELEPGEIRPASGSAADIVGVPAASEAASYSEYSADAASEPFSAAVERYTSFSSLTALSVPDDLDADEDSDGDENISAIEDISADEVADESLAVGQHVAAVLNAFQALLGDLGLRDLGPDATPGGLASVREEADPGSAWTAAAVAEVGAGGKRRGAPVRQSRPFGGTDTRRPLDPVRIGDKQVEAAVGLMREAWSAKEATVQARDEAVTELSHQVWELQARLQEREERVARLEAERLATLDQGVQHEAELLKMEQAHRQELELIAADAKEQIQMLETRLSQELRAGREAEAEERAELEAELEATRREGAGLEELLVEARDQLEALDSQTRLAEKELANKEREKRAATEALVAELGTKALERDSLLKEMAHLKAVHEESLELKAFESARKIRSYEVQVGVRVHRRSPSPRPLADMLADAPPCNAARPCAYSTGGGVRGRAGGGPQRRGAVPLPGQAARVQPVQPAQGRRLQRARAPLPRLRHPPAPALRPAAAAAAPPRPGRGRRAGPHAGSPGRQPDDDAQHLAGPPAAPGGRGHAPVAEGARVPRAVVRGGRGRAPLARRRRAPGHHQPGRREGRVHGGLALAQEPAGQRPEPCLRRPPRCPGDGRGVDGALPDGRRLRHLDPARDRDHLAAGRPRAVARSGPRPTCVRPTPMQRNVLPASARSFVRTDWLERGRLPHPMAVRTR